MRIGSLLILLVISIGLQAKTLLVVGDSISAGYGIELEQGWVQLLAERLAKESDYEVVNASVSGDTTAQGLSRLPSLLERHEPHIVVLELGGNDGLRGFPLKVMKNNLAQMIELSQEASARVLLVGIQIPPNYGTRYTQEFFKVYPQLAENYGVPYVPFILDGVAVNGELMQNDGIHPKAMAQPRLLDNVWSYLEPLLADNLAETQQLTREE